MTVVRCAIYTRKSSEEGLEQDFNSLDAVLSVRCELVSTWRSNSVKPHGSGSE